MLSLLWPGFNLWPEPGPAGCCGQRPPRSPHLSPRGGPSSTSLCSSLLLSSMCQPRSCLFSQCSHLLAQAAKLTADSQPSPAAFPQPSFCPVLFGIWVCWALTSEAFVVLSLLLLGTSSEPCALFLVRITQNKLSSPVSY